MASLFTPVGGRLAPILYIAVMIIWALIIVVDLFLNNFLKPSFLGWLSGLALNVALLSGTWIVSRKDI